MPCVQKSFSCLLSAFLSLLLNAGNTLKMIRLSLTIGFVCDAFKLMVVELANIVYFTPAGTNSSFPPAL